ncbi:unnamed protein product, partial [Rangifer tarandus platyrhynchus]
QDLQEICNRYARRLLQSGHFGKYLGKNRGDYILPQQCGLDQDGWSEEKTAVAPWVFKCLGPTDCQLRR